MDKRVGRTLRTAQDTATLTPEQRGALTESMLDTLVALHEIDPADVGLADWGRPDGYPERQVKRWAHQGHTIKTSERPQTAQAVRMPHRSKPTHTFPATRPSTSKHAHPAYNN